jgi:phage tail sheath protein FI
MPEQFLHGVEIVEIDDGARPITTVRSSVIGLVGTAPNSQSAAAAVLVTGDIADTTALTWTAKTAGAAGNAVGVHFKRPSVDDTDLAVSVRERIITVQLAGDADGVSTTNAGEIAAAVAAVPAAAALVTVTPAYDIEDPPGLLVGTSKPAYLSGGADNAFPLNTPVLCTRRTEAAALGAAGTLPAALDAIWDQAGAWVVVVRVEQAVSPEGTLTNIIGNGANRTGVHALLDAESVCHVVPRILIAPGFTHQQAAVSELVGIAERLRAVIVADGPNSTDAAAITYRGNFGSDRVYIVDPQVKVWDTVANAEAIAPASPRVAGIIAKSDNERGFWWSPSNREMSGIVGTARAVDFELGDALSRANYLNENEVATIIRKDGYRLWGNRSCSADPKWAFLSVRRTADMVHESLLRAHLWAVDRNITKTYIEDVVEGVNNYLSHLVKIGALLGGRCWADAELNTPDQIAQGKVFFDFDMTPPTPAEHITFRSHLVNDYLVEIFSQAA